LKKTLLCFFVGACSLGSLFANEKLPDSTRKSETRIEKMASPVEVSNSAGMHQPFQEQVISIKKDGPKLRISGFARFVGFYRQLGDYYSDTYTRNRGLSVPVTLNMDDGSLQPMLMLRMELNPTSKTSIMLESQLNNPFLSTMFEENGEISGASVPGFQGNTAAVFSRFALNATTVTDYGTIRLQAGGGMNWGKMSPFTMWTFQYRDDMFERYPWDPAGANWNRYKWYYSLGDIPRDLRWGRRAVQGFKFEFEDMPYGLEGMFFYGKTSVAASWNSWVSQIPQNVLAFRVAKKIKGHKIGFNFFDHFGNEGVVDVDQAGVINYQEILIDTVTYEGKKYLVEQNKTNQGSATIDGLFNVPGKLRFYTEIGMGWSRSGKVHGGLSDGAAEASTGEVVTYKRKMSPIVYAEVDWKNAPWFDAFKGTVYYVGRYFVNNSSAVLNSSSQDITDGRNFNLTGGGNDNTLYMESMVAEIGQVTNNRVSLGLELRKNFNNLVVDFGLGLQQEIAKVYQDVESNGSRLNSVSDSAQLAGESQNGVRNSVTIYHIANQYQRSRFMYNKNSYGPYNRLIADYRRAWENIAITDSTPDYFKKFMMVDLSLKYKLKVFKRDLIVTAFGRVNAVGESYSPANLFTDEAFVRQYFEEFMFFYNLHPKFSVLGIVNFEQLYGNERTELADEDGELILGGGKEGNLPGSTGGDPISQLGTGYGLGFDWDFTSRACISTRYRYYTHEDENFTRDKFSGHEVTCEFKLFF
jgi:hypothetical protein